MRYWDVYVDDFCRLIQGNKWERRAAKQALFTALDKIFHPLEVGEKYRQEPASIKKMLQGDAKWETTKVVLGWMIDTINKTIELPERRKKRLHDIFNGIRPTT